MRSTLERPSLWTPEGGLIVANGRDAAVFVGQHGAQRAEDMVRAARKSYRRGMRPIPEIAGGAVSLKWYGQAIMQAFGSGSGGGAPNIDFLSDTIKIMLTTSTYVPDQDAHVFKSDVTNEVAGTGYTATGATLGSPTLGYTSGTNVIKFDAADPAWTVSTITARIAVIYDSTPASDATRPLLCYIDFGADVSTTAGTFTIVFDAGGFLTITPA